MHLTLILLKMSMQCFATLSVRFDRASNACLFVLFASSSSFFPLVNFFYVWLCGCLHLLRGDLWAVDEISAHYHQATACIIFSINNFSTFKRYRVALARNICKLFELLFLLKLLTQALSMLFSCLFPSNLLLTCCGSLLERFQVNCFGESSLSLFSLVAVSCAVLKMCKKTNFTYLPNAFNHFA